MVSGGSMRKQTVIKYLTGAALGGIAGFFILYRLIGCSSGACAITTNPYISTAYGILLGLLLAGAVPLPVKTKGAKENFRPKTITAAEAKLRMDSGDELVILDVRTRQEYQAGHIPKAILIPNESIGKKPPEQLLDPDAEILVYCHSGVRSAQAARKLAALGYTNVYDFGGIINWPDALVKE